VKGRLVLHVGPLKTGTTYLQEGLRGRRASLREQGWLYPLSDKHLNHERALSSFLGPAIPWVSQSLADSRAKSGKELVKEANSWDGTLLLSAEALGAIDGEAAQRTLDLFPDRDVHVVVTARELGGTIPSHATQLYKVGRAEALSSICARFARERGTAGSSFWRMYDYAGLVQRWSALPRVSGVTVVTLPGRGADPGELWRRFAKACGLPDGPLREAPVVPPSLANLSPSAAEARLLRTVTLEARRQELDPKEIHELFSAILFQGLMPRPAESRRDKLRVPSEHAAEVRAWSQDDVRRLREMDVRVVGDLDELVARVPAPEDGVPDLSLPGPDEQLSLEAAAAVIVGMFRPR